MSWFVVLVVVVMRWWEYLKWSSVAGRENPPPSSISASVYQIRGR